MEVAHNQDLSSLSLSELVSLGYTNYLYYDGDCKKWILRSPDAQDQLQASFKMTKEEIKSQPTYTEQCDVRRCPFQKVEGQELGQGQGTHLQECQEDPPPPPTLGSQGASCVGESCVSRELFKLI